MTHPRKSSVAYFTSEALFLSIRAQGFIEIGFLSHILAAKFVNVIFRMNTKAQVQIKISEKDNIFMYAFTYETLFHI